MSLDPKTNRQNREAEKAKKQQDTPLNPPLPHKRQSFDPFFFSLEHETPAEEAERKAAER
jgi:uncharacterized membrane protein